MTAPRDFRWQAVTSIALVVGLGSIASPNLVLRVLGTRGDLAGRGALGWRLFGARNLAIVAGVLVGDRRAKVTAVALQAPDQVAFIAAFRSGDIETRTFILAMILSNVIVGLGASALASEDDVLV